MKDFILLHTCFGGGGRRAGSKSSFETKPGFNSRSTKILMASNNSFILKNSSAYIMKSLKLIYLD